MILEPVRDVQRLTLGNLPEDKFMFTYPGYVFRALCEHPHGLTIHELADMVYANHADGGPNWAQNCIWTQLNLMRRWLKLNYPWLRHEVVMGPRHVLVIKRPR